MADQLLGSITHVIFDLDGLLIDTETCYTIAYNAVTKQYGKPFTWDLKARVMGMSPNDSSLTVIKELNLPLDVNQFNRLIDEQFLIAIKDVELMAGAEQLVRHLSRHNIPMSIATGSNTEQFATKTAKFKEFFTKFFSHYVLAADDPHVKRGKPFPDVFVEAMNRFDAKELKSENVLVFEDSPLGVEAALAAQMPCVWVPDPRADVSTKNATLVLKSLEDFKPELFGLPPMQTTSHKN